MAFEDLVNRLARRRYRREHRKILQQWWDDGGDYRYRFDYGLDRESLVMDLGGYEGQWSSDLYSRHRCRILIFEPVSAFATRITERFSKNDDIQVLQYGLGATSRRETIYLHGAGSSTHRKRSESERIQIYDVKAWFDENKIAPVHLMKINIEGGEFELLERMIETKLIESIENIQVQFHNIAVDSADRMERIQKGMQRTHSPTYQYRFVWENWTRSQ